MAELLNSLSPSQIFDLPVLSTASCSPPTVLLHTDQTGTGGVQACLAINCLALVPDCSLIYCDSRETDGCSGPIRGLVKVMGFCFLRKAENQPSQSKLEASLRETKSSPRAEQKRIKSAVLDMPRYDFFPIFSAAH